MSISVYPQPNSLLIWSVSRSFIKPFMGYEHCLMVINKYVTGRQTFCFFKSKQREIMHLYTFVFYSIPYKLLNRV